MSDFINIHVFEGASQSSNQSIPFSAARGQILSEYGEIVRFTHLNVDQINFELKWQPKEVIDWCLSGDIFIATSHFHQGLETQRWIISELWSEYVRLRDMIAFPDTTECNGHHYDMQKHIITTVLGHIYYHCISVKL